MTTTNIAIASVALLTLAVDAWAIVALLRRPSAAFAEAGKSKALWLVLVIAGIFVCNAGFLVSLWYLFMVDPQVKRMEQLGAGIGYPTGTGNFPY